MKPIKLTDNTITLKNISSLISWLKKNPKLTKGDLTIKFEKLFKIWIKRKYSIFVNSGSSANLLIEVSTEKPVIFTYEAINIKGVLELIPRDDQYNIFFKLKNAKLVE